MGQISLSGFRAIVFFKVWTSDAMPFVPVLSLLLLLLLLLLFPIQFLSSIVDMVPKVPLKVSSSSDETNVVSYERDAAGKSLSFSICDRQPQKEYGMEEEDLLFGVVVVVVVVFVLVPSIFPII